MKLNLGCGKDAKEGFINLDMIKHSGVDVVHDLNIFPYPFKENTFDYVEARFIVEHLKEPIKFVEEIYRISKNKALLKIAVPHASMIVSSFWSDLTHIHPYSAFSFDIFKEDFEHNTYEKTEKARFKIKKKIYFSRLYFFFQLIFNLSDFTRSIYEAYFAGIFPARFVIFKMEVVKK